MPKVSVIVPTHNSAGHIAQTLESILAQTWVDRELIIVDDGSSDETCEIIAGYGDRIRLIRQTNAGVCTARNRGLAASSGDFVCFMDHDDFWFEDKLEHQLSAFANEPGLGVVFSAFTPWSADAAGHFPAPATLRSDATGHDPHWTGWVYHRLLIDNWVLTSSAMVRREALDTCGAFDETLPYGEDWDLWLRLSRHYRFEKLNRVTTLYRQLPGQGSRRFRSVDYRTSLLIEAVERWGLTGPDGSSLPRRTFCRQLYEYHLSYGLHCLQADQPDLAQAAFSKAWRLQPGNPKPIIYKVATVMGWRPSW